MRSGQQRSNKTTSDMNVLSILPALGACFAILAFFTSYIVAVVRKDVYPWWPYISDAGTTRPESCIFGELLTLTAITAMAGIIIRYKWIGLFNTTNKKLRIFNGVAFVIGGLSCFFMTMVANFQETSVRAVHMPVSAATFGLGLVYNILQTEITRRMTPKHSSVCVWILRVVVCILQAVSFSLLYGFGFSSNQIGEHWFGHNDTKRLHWGPTDAGWDLHLVATICEWIVGITTISYFLTFTFEFARIKLKLTANPVQTVSGEDDAPLLT